jgi:hypothetical protein
MTARVMTTAFWNTAPCSIVEVDRHFKGGYHHGDGPSGTQVNCYENYMAQYPVRLPSSRLRACGASHPHTIHIMYWCLIFMPMAWDRLWTAAINGPSVHPMICEHGEPRCSNIDRGKPKNSEKTFPSATFPTTKPTRSDPGASPGIRSKRPATNRLSSVTVRKRNPFTFKRLWEKDEKLFK